MNAPRGRRLWPWIVLLLGLPALSVAFWLFASRSEQKKKVDKRGRSGRADVAVRHPGRVLATGEIRPRVGAEVNVGTRISGRVDRVHAEIGHRVKAGDLLAELEKDELQAAVEKAKAIHAAARAKLALLHRGARTEEIKSAGAAVDQARAVVRTARLELKRKKALFDKKLIAQEEVDNARRDLQVAEAKLVSARSALSLKRKLYLPEEIALVRAHVAEARAGLNMAKVRLGYATIRSPIDGVVATVSIQSGETVSAGFRAPILVTIIDPTKLQVEAYVDEVDIGRVRVGRKASFTVDTYPEKTFKGTVQAIYPKAVLRDNVVNYLAIVSFSNPGSRLRPGMTANVTIEVAAGSRNTGRADPRHTQKNTRNP